MNVSMQKSDAVSARLTVEVTAADYEAKVKEELKKIGREHQIPGFRKGHVSMTELERRFGRQVTSDVINEVVFKAVYDYIEQNKLEVLGQPLPVEVKEIDTKKQQDFTFEYDLALAPEMHIELNKDINVPYYPIEVSDAMIDEQDKAFCKRFGAQVPGEEFEPDSLVKGSIMQLDADGNVKVGDDAIQVVSGIVAPMYFTSKEEAAKFEGKKPGDKVVFNPWESCNGNPAELSSMLQIDKDRIAEANCPFELAISEIIVVRPAEHNEEFYTNVFGADKVHNEEEYRAEVKNLIAGQLSANSEGLFRDDARKALMEKYGNIELPDTLLKKWLISRNEGLNEENIDKEYDQMRDDLKWQLIRENIAKNAGIKIEDDDLMEFAKGMAAQQLAQYGMTNMDMETITGFAKNILADKEWRPRIIQAVGDNKLYAAIKEAVTVEEHPMSLDAFKEMVTNLNKAAAEEA